MKFLYGEKRGFLTSWDFAIFCENDLFSFTFTYISVVAVGGGWLFQFNFPDCIKLDVQCTFSSFDKCWPLETSAHCSFKLPALLSTLTPFSYAAWLTQVANQLSTQTISLGLMANSWPINDLPWLFSALRRLLTHYRF